MVLPGFTTAIFAANLWLILLKTTNLAEKSAVSQSGGFEASCSTPTDARGRLKRKICLPREGTKAARLEGC